MVTFFHAFRQFVAAPLRGKIIGEKLRLGRHITQVTTVAHCPPFQQPAPPHLGVTVSSTGKRFVCPCCPSMSFTARSTSSNGAADDHQPLWKRQSPINIVTENTYPCETLKPLNFIKGWSQPMSGAIDNLGYTVTYRPHSSCVTTLQTHTGEYAFDNFHYHWGERSGCGSEHFVDGKQYDLEIHFVCKKVNNDDPSAGDAAAVVGVFGEVSESAKVEGIWKLIDPQRVQSHSSVAEVSKVVYSELLPGSCDYYYYEGSLTTPGYDEIVQWFVLREPIQVPAAYLEQLRSIKNEKGAKILNNYRELQNLNGRVVRKHESSPEEKK